MAFKPGHKKVGGRKKGTPDKRTLALQELWDQFNYDPAVALNKLLPQLEPEVQANVHLKLMPYKYCVKRSVEISGPNGQPIQQESSFDEEAKLLLEEFKSVVENAKNERS